MSRFRPDWRMTLFVMLMLPILVGLGLWQSDRARYKDELAAQFDATLGSMPQRFDAAATGLRRLRIQGRYGAAQLLLDNQTRSGQVGYWLLQSFQLAAPASGGDTLVLVNRGWVAAPNRRDLLPELPPAPSGTQSLVVLQWPDLGALPSFGASVAPESMAAGLWRIQRLDWPVLSDLIPGLVAAEMRLEAGQPGVLIAAPARLAFGAQRHRGYAVQWFGLALTLFIGFIVYGLKRS